MFIMLDVTKVMIAEMGKSERRCDMVTKSLGNNFNGTFN